MNPKDRPMPEAPKTPLRRERLKAGYQAAPRTGKRPAPRADYAKRITVRVDPEEFRAINRDIEELVDLTGRTSEIDKAEMIRELLVMAREHEPTRNMLIRRLKQV